MARQLRSEATRRRLLDAAIDEFGDTGCVAAGRAAIVERAGMTKGALYHHFESMDALVLAIIDGGFSTVLDTFRRMCRPSSPALEGMIHGMFAATGALVSDKEAKIAGQLVFALAGSSPAAGEVCGAWLKEVTAQIRRAISEGDLRADLDPDRIAESIVGAMLGAWLLGQAIDGDAVGRVTQAWQVLLPAMVAAEAQSYYQEFLAREAFRHQPDAAYPAADHAAASDRRATAAR